MKAKESKEIKKENNQVKNLKIKLISTLASLVACFLIVGITVFAATQQVVTVDDTVTVSSEVQVAVTVEQKFGPTDLVLITGTEYTDITGGTFTNIVAKASTVNSASGSGENPNFSYTAGYTYTAYKITMVNESTTEGANYNITLNGFPTGGAADQLTIHYADGSSMSNNGVLTGTIVAGETTTVYIIIAINTPMTELVPLATENYTLNVNLVQAL